ncbi:MAG: hybrid sensor histidine kinase/response regulator [Cyanobacteria bacterium SBLK]|nr:hybrid sensor histidine kinase/response regulator [Cyanobacteria bacterium SBLK]
MKAPSILIVDDEPDNFDVIETLLNEGDWDLYYAANGREGIAFLEILPPDLVLLDVMMPGMDGIEVCQTIKANVRWQAIPVIAITALTAKEDLARCLAAGADDFISKPVNRYELRARIQSLLRIKYQYDRLQTLFGLREDMVKMIVHDLRNPLTGVLANLELLDTMKSLNTDLAWGLIDRAHSSAQMLQGLIDDLLTISSIESGKIRLNRTEVDLCALIHAVLGNFEAIAAQKNQVLVSHFSLDSEYKISGDFTTIRRLLDNLLSNAIKFSPNNSEIVVNVEWLEAGNSKIQVIDSGAGIPEALQQKIFEKYEVGTPMPDISQIGLGLAFCKMVAEAHGGNICVKNNQPRGSIFELTLPA